MSPRKPDSNAREQRLERLRAICLALPEAHEKIAWGDPTFRVRDKIAPKTLAARVKPGSSAPRPRRSGPRRAQG